MLLTIDIGNTNIVFAVFDGNKIVSVWRCESNANLGAEFYQRFLSESFDAEELSFSQIDGVVLGSVVPKLDPVIQGMCQACFECDAFEVRADSINLMIDMDNPEEVGADRLVNAISVIHDYRCPAIIVDFGTATTFDVIDNQGTYCGGIIAPGVNLSLQALEEAAAKLPKIDITKPAQLVGKNTVDAMQSGLYWGYASMVQGLLNKLTADMGVSPFVIATGGLAGFYKDAVPSIEKIDEYLTLRGLCHIYGARK